MTTTFCGIMKLYIGQTLCKSVCGRSTCSRGKNGWKMWKRFAHMLGDYRRLCQYPTIRYIGAVKGHSEKKGESQIRRRGNDAFEMETGKRPVGITATCRLSKRRWRACRPGPRGDWNSDLNLRCSSQTKTTTTFFCAELGVHATGC
jgi:hypothetical protein